MYFRLRVRTTDVTTHLQINKTQATGCSLIVVRSLGSTIYYCFIVMVGTMSCGYVAFWFNSIALSGSDNIFMPIWF